MKAKRTLLTMLILAMCIAKISWAAPMGTAFTYQGRLVDANSPAEGLYDFKFAVFDALEGGGQQSSTVSKDDVDVIDGYFTTILDFGSEPNLFKGDAQWLEIAVRPGEYEDPCDYVILQPRQEITPAPYALHTTGVLVDGTGNVLVGTGTGENNTGNSATFVGDNAGYNNQGDYNTFVGNSAGQLNTQGYSNTFLGYAAGLYTTEGYENTFLGNLAGYSNTTGSGNVFIGHQAGYNETGSDKLYIANGWPDSDVLIYGDFSTGRLGLGTTSPSERLEVNGTVKATAFAGDGSGLTGLPSDTDWNEAGVNVYRVAGNVGIGTSGPGVKLDVAGDGIRVSNATGASLTAVGSDNNSDPFLALVAKDDEASQKEWRLYNKGSAAGMLSFFDATAAQNRMVIDSDGNVGIGTTSPTEALEVNGTVEATAFVGDGSGLTGIATGDSDWTISGNDMYTGASVSGNVGIGITPPTAKLHIGGIPGLDGIKFPDGTTQTSAALADGHSLDASDGSPLDAVYVDIGGNTYFTVDAVGLGIVPETSAASIAYVDDSSYYSNLRLYYGKTRFIGKVGIETTSPQNELDVEGAVAIGATYSGTDTAPANGMIVEGNVGIGIPNPDPLIKLEVDGPISAFRTGTAGVIKVDDKRASGGAWNLYSGQVTQGDFSINEDEAGNAARLYIEAGGEVGIGTTTPARKLHINDVMRLEPRSSAPSSPSEGDIYYNGTLHQLMYYNGTIWVAL